MWAAVLTGPEKIVLKDVPKPSLEPKEVLIEVAYCGICGSDLTIFKMGLGMGSERIMGHEFSGIIVEVGKDIKKWKVGDRVVVEPSIVCGECYWCVRNQFEMCNSLGFIGIHKDGAFAEFVKASDYQLHKLPEDVTYKQGALVEPLATALHGLRLAGFREGEDIFVIGAGPMGLSAMLCARALGASKIYASEIAGPRINLAKKIADEVFNPMEVDVTEEVMDRTRGLGVDLVVECTGKSNAQELALQLAKKLGRIVYIGTGLEPFKITSLDLIMKELQLFGCLAYRSLYNCPGEFPEILHMIRDEKIKPEIMVTSVIPLNEIENGFHKMLQATEGKILVEPKRISKVL